MIQPTEVRSIGPENLYSLWREDETVEVIDVRPAADFAESRVPMARSVPWAGLDPHDVIDHRSGKSDDPLYIICQIGGRSAQACQKFLEAGFQQVVNVEGGTEAWQKAGLPVVVTNGAVSVRRQVQISAGSLVLVGTIMGATVHPWFYALAVFIGAGLVFSGITNTCAMGSILAQMPWNR